MRSATTQQMLRQHRYVTIGVPFANDVDVKRIVPFVGGERLCKLRSQESPNVVIVPYVDVEVKVKVYRKM